MKDQRSHTRNTCDTPVELIGPGRLKYHRKTVRDTKNELLFSQELQTWHPLCKGNT
jgi:hypothetical protein